MRLNFVSTHTNPLPSPNATIAPQVSLPEAVAAVHGADAVVLAVGTFARWGDTGWGGEEGEGVDRKDLLMPINQTRLIEAVAEVATAQQKPVVVVVMSGGE